MGNKLAIFVDTSYLLKKWLDSAELENLIQGAKKAEYVLQFYTTSIIKTETLKNFREQVRATRCQQFLRVCIGPHDAEKFIQTKVEEQFENLNFEIIDEAEVLELSDYQSILSKFKRLEPPFSEKKSNEFKDAYVLLAIERFISSHEFDIVGFISLDEDWKTYLQSAPHTNYIVDLVDIKKFLNEKESEIKQQEKLRMLEQSRIQDFNEKYIKDLKIKLAKEIEAYASLDKPNFKEKIADEISDHYHGDISYDTLLEPIRELAVERNVEIENFNVEILNCTPINQPALDLDSYEEEERLDSVLLKGQLNCHVTFSLSFEYRYGDDSMATVDEDQIYTYTMGGTATLEGVADIGFDCTDLEFSGEDFEVGDISHLEILEEDSLVFYPEDLDDFMIL
jgi:hypothetical protein